jgi:uncharacterized membrane protein
MPRFLPRLAALRHTYWFWPSTMTLVAVVLGFALPWLDQRLGSEWMRQVGFVRATQVDGARAILTTLAAATLGVAGVAFSITMVAVSFATSNYGPRLIGNFMADRTNQVVLGVFVATFVYCIIVLSTVHARAEFAEETLQDFVPQISILLALGLTLASVGALIGYIHHIPESINIMNLTAGIGVELRARVVAIAERGAQEQAPSQADPAIRSAPETTVRATRSGFLQEVDHDTLEEVALEQGLALRVLPAVGDFVVEGEAVIAVRAEDRGGDALTARLRDALILGRERTASQDVLFLSDQLVEVAVRALSPGINDPHTATLCLDWLRAGLDAFARAGPLPEAPIDALVRHRRITFEAMLDRSFDRLRQHAAADRTVTLHALEALASLAAVATTDQMTAACRRQMRLLAEAADEQLPGTQARKEVGARLDALASTAPAPAPTA